MNPHDDAPWFPLGSDRTVNPATGESLNADGVPLPPTLADVLAASEAADAADEVIARGSYTCEDLARMRESYAVAIATGDAYGRAERAAKVAP